MPRKKSAEPLEKKKITLRKSTIKAVEEYLLDPMTGRAKYGGWSSLIESLLRQHLKEVANVSFDDLLDHEERP